MMCYGPKLKRGKTDAHQVEKGKAGRMSEVAVTVTNGGT